MPYAIFSTGGAQFRAEPGVTIKVPLLAAEPGSKVTFDQVLLASDGKQVHAGKPVVKGAKVTAEIVRHGKGKKIKIYRFARRSGYRRHGGHRQQFTEIKIADVKLKGDRGQMAHKKGVGSSRNGRDSGPKYLGVKRFAGEHVTADTILVKQRGTKFHPGVNVRRASDDTLFTVVDGQVRFEHKNKKRYQVSVYPKN